MGSDQASRTLPRRLIVAACPSRPPRWLSPWAVWRAYGFAEWLSYRLSILAMELEDARGR